MKFILEKNVPKHLEALRSQSETVVVVTFYKILSWTVAFMSVTLLLSYALNHAG